VTRGEEGSRLAQAGRLLVISGAIFAVLAPY